MSLWGYALIATLLVSRSCSQTYKICVTQHNFGRCDSMERGDTPVICEKVQDSVDCALKIQQGKADFGIFQPEQALLVSTFLAKELAVVGEIRILEDSTRRNSFETVVLVDKNHDGGLANLKDKSYCRTNVNEDDLWTRRVGEEVENAIFKENLITPGTCSQNGDSSVTYRLKQLADILGDSCLAGRWLDDVEYDSKLKRTNYKSLCNLCTKDNCLYEKNEDFTDMNEYPIRCLENNGYFALTTLSAVDAYYTTINKSELKDRFKFLCRNGTLADIENTKDGDCSWRNQPWPMILSSPSAGQNLQRDFKNWYNDLIAHTPKALFSHGNSDAWKSELKRIITSSNVGEGIYVYEEIKSLSEVLKENNQQIIYDDDDKCPIRWCTVSSAEQQKCLWLSQASKNQGLYPLISCIQSESVYHCMFKIKNKQADAMMIDSNHGYLARRNNLRNLLYVEEKHSDISTIVALIKSDSNIASFDDLKNKKACFPEYQGIAWLAFIKAARDKKIFSNSCNYGEMVANYFSSVCAPGAHDQLYHQAKSVNQQKLCNLCKDRFMQTGVCEASYMNKYFNNNGSLSCLDEGGDVAFIEKEVLDLLNVNMDGYKVLCKSGTVVSLNQVDSECPLVATIDSEIIFRGDDKRKEKYIELLNKMDDIFGTQQTKNQPMEMFKLFNGTKNLMFKSKSLGFDSNENPNNPFVKSYVELFKHVDKCTGASSVIVPSLLVVFMAVNLMKMLQSLLS